MLRFLLPFLFLPFLANGQALMDGFSQRKGSAAFAFSMTYQKAPEYFAGKDPVPLTREHYIANLFGTYGVTDRFDLILNIPFIKGRYLDGIGRPQDGELLFSYECVQSNLSFGKLKLLLGVGGRYPLSNYATETAQAIGQQARTLITRGNLQLDMKGPLFFEFMGGYDASAEPVPASYQYSGKLGASFKYLYAALFYQRQIALGGKDYRGKGDRAPNSFRELGVGFHRLGIDLYKPLKEPWGISAASSYIPSGRNTGKNITLSLGLVYQVENE